MFAIVIFVLVVLVLCYVFYLRRKREAAAFRDASYADFVEFDGKKTPTPEDNRVVNEVAAGVISAAAAAIEQRQSTATIGALEDAAVYLPKGKLFDEVTRSLLANLHLAIGDDYLVLLKMPVSELLSQADSVTTSLPTVPPEKVDFVICRRADLTPVCCIQHSGGAVEKLSRVFKNSGMPFLHLAVGTSYCEAELKELLKDIIRPAPVTGSCRSCQQPMVIKRVRGGKSEGQYFWVCSACKLNIPVR